MCKFCVTVHNDDMTKIYELEYARSKSGTTYLKYFINAKDALKWADHQSMLGKLRTYELGEVILN